MCCVLLCVGVVVGVVWLLVLDPPVPPCNGPPHARPPQVFLLPPPFSFFFCLSECLLVEFWCCSRRPEPANMPVWALGLSCETLAAPKGKKTRSFGPPFGAHHDTHTRSRNELAKNMDCLAKLGGPKPRWPKRDWPKSAPSVPPPLSLLLVPSLVSPCFPPFSLLSSPSFFSPFLPSFFPFFSSSFFFNLFFLFPFIHYCFFFFFSYFSFSLIIFILIFLNTFYPF